MQRVPRLVALREVVGVPLLLDRTTSRPVMVPKTLMPASAVAAPESSVCDWLALSVTLPAEKALPALTPASN